MKRNFILLISLMTLLLSCSKPEEDEVATKYSTINNYLSEGECDSAESELDDIADVSGIQTNQKFIIYKSLIYACRAEYSTLDFLAEFVDEFDETIGIFVTLAQLETSSLMTGPDDYNFTTLYDGIDLLAYANGAIDSAGDPSAENRRIALDLDSTGDIETLLSFTAMVDLGMFVRYFAGVHDDGSKDYECMLDYTGLVGMGDYDFGTCNPGTTVSTGNPELVPDGGDTPAEVTLKLQRSCKSIVLFNRLTDSFTDIADAFGLEDVQTMFDDAITDAGAALDTATGGLITEVPLIEVRSLDDCVTAAEADYTDVLIYYTLLEYLFDAI